MNTDVSGTTMPVLEIILDAAIGSGGEGGFVSVKPHGPGHVWLQ